MPRIADSLLTTSRKSSVTPKCLKYILAAQNQILDAKWGGVTWSIIMRNTLIPPYILSYTHRDGRIKPTWTGSAWPLLHLFTLVLKAAVSLISSKTSAKTSLQNQGEVPKTHTNNSLLLCAHIISVVNSLCLKACVFSTHWKQPDKLVTCFT